jgi:hypothetical protein
MAIPPSVYQLVMRARHYKSRAYGLPLSVLNRSFEVEPFQYPSAPITIWTAASQNTPERFEVVPIEQFRPSSKWTVSVAGAFDQVDNLIIRITSTILARDFQPYNSFYDNLFAGTCRCQLPQSTWHRTLVDLRSDINDAASERLGVYQLGVYQLNGGLPNEWGYRWHECPSCRASMIAKVRVTCRFKLTEHAEDKLKHHYVRVYRYHNLGLASDFNSVPQSAAFSGSVYPYGGPVGCPNTLRMVEALFKPER